MTRDKLLRISRTLEGVYGVPRWAGPRDPLEILVRAILSQNTNDINSGRAYRNLRERFPTWEDVAEAPVEEVAEAIRVGGLSGIKAGRIQGVLRWARGKFGGFRLPVREMDVDKAMALLCGLEGVGIKTASVVLLFACGRDVFPVDTHIHRVCTRLGLLPPRTSPEEAHRTLGEMVPEGKSYPLHLNLIHFGREICHAQRPECGRCPLWDKCIWEGKGEK
ncbi:MAG TPA: endonuclease III [Candidatus Latescibacteria bacterium]|nr:endonuclease III [Candidatus Latescibacterota bacterium]